MRGDVGPYLEMDGPLVWVPRTVPYLDARRVAKTALDDWRDSLRYIGKEDALLLGFSVECQCEEVCERVTRCDESTDWSEQETGDRTCYSPAWKFEAVER